MRLETFFEKFEQFADAPNAVAKMRELILDFAAQGRLTERKTDDGHASDVVAAIAKERALLTAKKVIRKQSALPELSLEELPFCVPPSWTWVRLGNCVASYTDDFVDGPFGSNLKADEYTEHGIPIVRLKNIGRNQFKSKDIKFIPQKKADELKRHSFKPGDLLLNKLGEPVGKCCIAPKELGSGIIVADVIRLRLSDKVFDSRFVSLIINSPAIAQQLLAQITGITRDRVSLEKLRNLAIPLPPLAEQKRIVAKVDELMALCDRLEAQQQKRDARHAALARASLARFADTPTPANLNFLFHKSYAITPADLRKTILTLAVQGKLVPQDPNDEPARALLERIQNEKTELIRGGVLKRIAEGYKEKNARLPFELPAGWEFVTLSELCTSITDGDHLPPPKTDSGIPFLVISNVRWGGIDYSDTRYVSEEYFRKLDPIRKPRSGDILYTLVGSFGIPIVVNVDQPFCVQRHIGILRPSSEMSVSFLAYLLSSDFVLAQVSAIATGIAQKTIPLFGLRRLSLPLPPLAEQRRIVAKVDQLMALVNQLETQLAASHATAKNLWKP